MYTVQTHAQLNNCYCQNINWLLKFNQWLAKNSLITEQSDYCLQITCLTALISGHKWTKTTENYQKMIFFKYHEIGIPWHETGRWAEIPWDFSPRREISQVCQLVGCFWHQTLSEPLPQPNQPEPPPTQLSRLYHLHQGVFVLNPHVYIILSCYTTWIRGYLYSKLRFANVNCQYYLWNFLW